MRIAVANPGTHPEMMRVAGGLIHAGHRVRYFTSSSWATDSPIQRLARTRILADTSIGSDLRRRELPSPLLSVHVEGVSRAQELLVQLAMRTGRGRVSQLIRKRNENFQNRVVRAVIEGAGTDVIVAQYTAAQGIFRGTPDSALKVLNYPITHHRWLKSHMQKEAEANPTWAPLLQGHDFTTNELRLLDEEIAMADVILVPSTFAASTFIESGVPKEKLSIVPLGCAAPSTVGSPGSVEQPRAEDGPYTGELKIIFAGQATQRKGLGYLVDAVSECPQVHLTVVGPASQEGKTFLSQHPNIRWIPSVPRARLYELLAAADLLVLPSLAEGFGLVALEAMANGTPCLLSDRTFAPDLIQDRVNGYLLPEVSKAAILSALLEISMHKEKLVMVGTRAAETAAAYSWKRYAESVTMKIEEFSGIKNRF